MARTAAQLAYDELEAASAVTDASRTLGSLEHLFWLLDQNRSFHFAVTALISGKASPDDWREALDRLQERHPILSVGIEGRPGSIPRFRQEVGASIPLRIVEGDPNADWEGEVGEELATPFDPAKAPLMRAVLIQGKRDTAFILVAHHSIADGLSLAYAIRDTLVAVSGRQLESLPASLPQEEILGAYAGQEAATSAPDQQDSAAAGKPATYRPLDNARPKVNGLRLSPALTKRLRARARGEGTTVHGALSAALAIAGRRLSPAWREIPLRVINPINIRPLLGVGDNCGLFVGATASVLDGKGMDFWDLAREAKTAVAAGQEPEAIVAHLSAIAGAVGNGIEVSTAAEFAASTLAHEAVLTNLGVLPFGGRFGRLKLETLWGPAVLIGMDGVQTVGVATVNESICLIHTSHTPPQGLLGAMGDVLVEASR